MNFTVHMEPRGKGRARSTKTGHHYTPEATMSGELLVGMAWHEATAGKGYRPIPAHVGVSLTVMAGLKQPKRKTTFYPVKKPDWDNIGKLVSDALNGKAWVDDTQVVDAKVVKRWDDTGKVVVIVRPVQAWDDMGPWKEIA